MIDKLRWIWTDHTCPYGNLALEEYLTTRTKEGECILYLWQNRHTVVIGRNQNCWKECKVNFLEEEGGYLARRLSGGGAVFHDLGNLNFTFMARKADYSVERQLDVIIEAVRMLGIEAVKTGRNDITADGKKFSGNAFFQVGDFCCHHGTLLLHVDKENMSRYLNVSKEKLQSKSVDSVKSRVANLTEYNPDITVEGMKERMIQAFSKVYGLTAKPLEAERIDWTKVKELETKFASWEWKYGRKIPFEYQISKRFEWGDIDLQLHVNQGRILEVNVFSDAMDQEMIGSLPKLLEGCAYGEKDMAAAIGKLEAKMDTDTKTDAGALRKVKEDLLQLIHESI